MKKIFLVLIVFCFSINLFGQNDKVTTYYLIRHAEKVATDKSDKDPHLNSIGFERAEYWSKVFKNVDFDLIYSTNYNRTKQTAQSTAKSKNLEVKLYDPKDLYNPDFQLKTKGKTVLIVGHSNSTPQFVNKIINKEKYHQIDEDNNSNLYIITITENVITDILLCI